MQNARSFRWMVTGRSGRRAQLEGSEAVAVLLRLVLDRDRAQAVWRGRVVLVDGRRLRQHPVAGLAEREIAIEALELDLVDLGRGLPKTLAAEIPVLDGLLQHVDDGDPLDVAVHV